MIGAKARPKAGIKDGENFYLVVLVLWEIFIYLESCPKPCFFNYDSAQVGKKWGAEISSNYISIDLLFDCQI